MSLKLTLLQTAAMILLGAGCSTSNGNRPHTGSGETSAQRLEIDGLALGAYPITEKATVKKIFGLNLLAEGVVPIKVVAENNSSSSSFVIAKDKVVVMTETSTATNFTQHGEAAKDLSRVSREQQVRGKEAATVGILLATPLVTAPILTLMVWMAPIDAEMIDRNREYKLASKEFYTRTLRPGQGAEGYIFYRIPNEPPHSGTYNVVAQVQDSAKEAPTAFDIRVSLNLPHP